MISKEIMPVKEFYEVETVIQRIIVSKFLEVRECVSCFLSLLRLSTVLYIRHRLRYLLSESVSLFNT